VSSSSDTSDSCGLRSLEADIERCRLEIRRRLLVLIEHPEVPQSFKNSRVVKELTK
jgi:hypothetical protein